MLSPPTMAIDTGGVGKIVIFNNAMLGLSWKLYKAVPLL